MKYNQPPRRDVIPEHADKVFDGEIFDVYQWQQKMFNGSFSTFEALKRADTANVIAVTPEKKILVLEEEQPNKPMFLGVVGGRIDDGEEPLQAAIRELREETGYEAGSWELWFSSRPLSKIDWTIYNFIAKDCVIASDQNLDAGEKIKIELYDFDRFTQLGFNDDFHDKDIKLRLLSALVNSANLAELRQILLSE